MRWNSTPDVVGSILRIAVGLPMMFIGIAHYRDFAPFVANVTDGLGWLNFAGTVWAYILPALLVFGGAMLAVGRYSFVAAWVGGIALGSIPFGLLLKTVMTGSPLPDMLDAATPAVLWLILFSLALSYESRTES